MVVRSSAKACHWCGQPLCHKCRKAEPDKPAKCGGHRESLCLSASTRDHLIPRTREKNRKKYSGYAPGPPMVVACWWCNTSRGDRADDHWRMFLTVSVYEGEAEVKRQAVLARFDEATAAAFEITKSFR